MSTDNPFASILTPSAAADQMSIGAPAPTNPFAGMPGAGTGGNPFASFADPIPAGLKVSVPGTDNSVFNPPPTPFDSSPAANNVVSDTSGVHSKVTQLHNALTALQNDTTGAAFAGGSAFPGQTGGQNNNGYTRDAQGNVYDASGKYTDLASLPKGANGQPLMNLQTLPVGQYTGGAPKSDSGSGAGSSSPFDSNNGTILPPGYSRNASGLIVDSAGKVVGYNQGGTNYNTNGSVMTGPVQADAGPGTDSGTYKPPTIPGSPEYGKFTDTQNSQIENAGKAAGGVYDNLIAEAMYNKNQGLAKSEVAAGERGGFMNTQFAGLAAVLPTQGGTWEGQGGQLQNIQGTYDRQIAQLQVQKNDAIQKARMAIQEYINTGNQKSFDNAMTSYNAAVAAHKDAIAAANSKVDELQKWANLQETLNKPLVAQEKAMQDYAYTQMAKYPSAFTGLTAEQLKTITPAQINTMITGSKEYKDEILKAHNEAIAAGRKNTGTGVGGGGTGPGGGLNQSSTDFWAQAASSGVNMNSLLPSLGMGAAAVATKQRLLETMAKQATTLGIDGSTFAAMVADSKAKQSTYTALQKVGSQTQVNEANANKNFEQLIGLSQKLDKSKLNTAVPVLNEWIRSGELKLTGDPDVNNFLALLSTSLTEYAKVVSGQTGGAAVTVSANNQAEKLLSAGMNTDTIKSFAQTAKQEMGNRTSSYNDALKGLFGNIKALDDKTGGLGGIGTQQSVGSIPGEDVGGAKQYIQAAIADKANYPTREALIEDIAKHNPQYKKEDIANLVYSNWSDTQTR